MRATNSALDPHCRRNGQGAADESGFALVTVLAVIALTAVVFGALLTLMLLTIRVTENHQRAERERRAADGAISATLNQIRLNGSDDGCGGIPSTLPGFDVEFDLPSGSDTVEVTCEPGEGQYGEPAGEVKLLGDGYVGQLANWRSAWPWGEVGGALAAVGAPGVNPSLIHTGREPLRFNAHVNTIAGAAALRDPTSGSPALEVRGQYRQAASGLGATGNDCGLLAEPGSPLLIDTVADRICGDEAALSEANPADYAIDQNVPTLPSLDAHGCPAELPGESVVTFDPGRYDRAAVKTLNGWFDGSCPGRTFHFPSGIYWFDAYDLSQTASDRSALVIDDPSSSFVFGQPSGWTTGDGVSGEDFPTACDAEVSAAVPGASIVLSGRTSLKLRAGRLAVCPYVSPGGQPYPALLQQSTIPTAIKVTPGTELDLKPVTNLVSGSVTATPRASVTMSCWVGPSWDPVTCVSRKNFEVNLSTSGGSDGPVSALRIGLVGAEPNYPLSAVQRRTVSFTLTTPSAKSCTTDRIDGAPINANETTFDLMSGDCPSKGLTYDDLNGAKIKAQLQYDYPMLPCFDLIWGCSVSAQKVEIWDVIVEADAWVGDATSIPAAGVNGWANPGNARLDDNLADVRMLLPCGFDACADADPAPGVQTVPERSLTLEGFSTSSSFASSDELTDVGVVVKQQGSQVGNFFGIEFGILALDGTTRISLELADGSTCTREFSGVTNRVGATYYPMVTDGAIQCTMDSGGPPGRPTAELLEGASVTVGIELACYWVTLFDITKFRDVTYCVYVRPINLQYVGLVATTNSYKGSVTESTLTFDTSDTSGSHIGTSANFYGAGLMPHSALDLLWDGGSSGNSIFGGELQLWSLGSRMRSDAHADVVCCTRPDTQSSEIRLTAHVADRPVLSIVALVSPDGTRPKILEWTQCGRNGTCDPDNPG